MKKHFLTIMSFSAAVLLGACGGGSDGTAAGDGPVAAVADKFVGTWSGCFANGAGSDLTTVAITKTGDASANFVQTDSSYAGAGCTGTPTATSTESGSVVLSGTKTIGADTVDKAIMTLGAQTKNQVLLVKGTAPVTLASGRSAGNGGVMDADGYPTTLDNEVLIKQSAAGDGGGGGGPVAAVADKYVGTWSGCFANGAGSDLTTVAITKTGDASANFVQTDSSYAGAGCTGTPTATSTESGSVVLSGTKTIGADTVDKAVMTLGAQTKNQVLLVKGTAPVTLTSGRSASNGGVMDADGYPTTLESESLIKQ